MTTWRLLVSAWNWEPSVLLGCAVLLAAYLVAVSFRFSKAGLSFVAGVGVLLLALVSPIDTLGDAYLFSAHMLQHLLLVLIVPPLLLLGIPAELARQFMRWPLARRAEVETLYITSLRRHPLLAWSLGVGMMWLWHVPALYNAALDHAGIHVFEHLCFLVTAAIFWWPIAAPSAEARLAPLAAMLYLFAAAGASTVLGIILTFVSPGLYPLYLQPTDRLGILPLLRDVWGFSPAVDQEAGGILMWVGGGLVYLGAIIATLALWYGAPDEGDTPASMAGEIGRAAPLAYQGRK
jgi:cytochrome c oxidase assembly factor CtaG